MNLCIDCRHRWPDHSGGHICNRPAAFVARLGGQFAKPLCTRERHIKDATACGQMGRFFEERTDREDTRR